MHHNFRIKGGYAQVRALGENHTGCAILIYDINGNHLGNTLITHHDKTTMRIQVQVVPPALDVGVECTLLILSSPTPCEYHGRLTIDSGKKVIALYRGRERENRGATRFAVNSPAVIENLICNGKAYRLHTPVNVELMNISKSGVRFRAQNNALSDGDRFQMRMRISESEKLLIADAIHHVDLNKASEYGCRFLIGSERVV